MSGSTNLHARLSPSGAERWADCTASVAYAEKLKADGKIPEREPDNVYAIAGTFAHDMAETILLFKLGKQDTLRFNLSAIDYKELNKKSLHRAWLAEQDFFGVEEKEILDYMESNDYTLLEEYVDYCMSVSKHRKDRVFVEVKAPLFYSDDRSETGTCDFFVEHKDGSITIVDLKWRRSGMVESVENYQLAIYCNSYLQNYIGLGFMKEPSAGTDISLATFNPLVAPHVRPWETNYGFLKQFCQRFIDAKELIDDGNYTVFVPTDKACKWCPVAKHKKCPALNAKVKFAMPNSLNMEDATDADLVRFFQFFPEIESYAKRVKEHLTRIAENGNAIEGTKLVKGRDGNRKFIDVEEGINKAISLGLKDDEIYKPLSPKTPTQISALIKKRYDKDVAFAFEKDYTERPEGRMTLVADTDDRPTIKSVKEGLFKGLKK